MQTNGEAEHEYCQSSTWVLAVHGGSAGHRDVTHRNVKQEVTEMENRMSGDPTGSKERYKRRTSTKRSIISGTPQMQQRQLQSRWKSQQARHTVKRREGPLSLRRLDKSGTKKVVYNYVTLWCRFDTKFVITLRHQRTHSYHCEQCSYKAAQSGRLIDQKKRKHKVDHLLTSQTSQQVNVNYISVNIIPYMIYHMFNIQGSNFPYT